MPPNPCWGSYPAGEYWNFIQASMPNWVLPPGDNPLVAAFPVPEVYVTPGSWHVERVTTITTSQGEMTQTSNSYETSVTRGQSTSIADTVTWNNWEEVSEAVETPLGTAAVGMQPQCGCTDFWSGGSVCEPSSRRWGGSERTRSGGMPWIKHGSCSGSLTTGRAGDGIVALIGDTLKAAFER